MIVTKFKVPIYGSSVWVVVDKSFHRAFDKIEDIIDIKLAEPEQIKTIKAYTFAFEKDNGKYQTILFFKPKADPGTIAHEVKHLINIIFSWHSVKLSLVNDEHECYLLGNIVNRCYKAVNKYKQ